MKAKEVVLGVLSVLDQHLLPRTFLVGDAVTLADISVACALLLLFTQVRRCGAAGVCISTCWEGQMFGLDFQCPLWSLWNKCSLFYHAEGNSTYCHWYIQRTRTD